MNPVDRCKSPGMSRRSDGISLSPSSSKETHQLAQANDEKNRRLREAFGIGEFNQKEIAKQKLEAAKEVERRKAEIANRQYT